MENVVRIHKYEVSFLNSSVQIKMNKKDARQIILDIVIVAISIALFVFPLIGGINGAGAFYIVLSACGIGFILFLTVYSSIIESKRLKKYLFTINQNGVTHVDIDGTYFLSWDKIACFGCFGKNSISGIRRTAYYTQSCVFFSKEGCDESQLKKALDRIGNKRYGHASTSNMIVWDMGQEDDGAIYNRIKDCMSEYCKDAIEIKTE